MNTAESKTLNSNSYDPDDGEPQGYNNGIQKWNWDIYSYSAGEYMGPRYRNVNSSFTFSPIALGLSPGRYEVELNFLDDDHEDEQYNYINGYNYYIATEGDWRGTRNVFVLGIDNFEDYFENCIPYGTGNTYEYSLEPEPDGYWETEYFWEPDILYLYIKDASGNTAYIHYAFGWNDEIGLTSAIEWDGIGNRTSYNGLFLPPGNYTARLDILKQGTIMKKTIPLIVYQPQIKVNIEDSIVNDVSSGLDVSTLVFKLNNVEISHECLEFEPDYTGSILTGLEISYFPNASELILFGENTVVVDIDDNVDNYMETLIQTFYLPW